MNSSEELENLSLSSEEDAKNENTNGINTINKIETEILDFKNKQEQDKK